MKRTAALAIAISFAACTPAAAAESLQYHMMGWGLLIFVGGFITLFEWWGGVCALLIGLGMMSFGAYVM